MAKFTIFYPSYVIGGAEHLTMRLAKRLVDRGHTVYYVDYTEGFYLKNFERFGIDPQSITFIPYEKEYTRIPDDTTVLFASCQHCRISDITFPPNSKMILYSFDKLDLIIRIKELRVSGQIILDDLREKAWAIAPDIMSGLTDAIQAMAKHRGIIAIEGYTRRSINTLFGANIDENDDSWIAPTPCTPSPLQFNSNEVPALRRNGEIHVGWLGRLSGDKAPCVRYIIDNAIRVAHAKPSEQIHVHVIGTGHLSKDLQHDTAPLPENCHLHWVGTLTHHALDFYIRQKLDVLFAMGTSLLEGAKLAIPSVIIDSKLEAIPLTEHVAFLYESSQGLVGEYSGQATTPRQHHFNDIIDKVKANKDMLGKKCYDYWKQHHIIDVTADKIIAQAERCTFTTELYEQHNFFRAFEKPAKQDIPADAQLASAR